MRWLWRWAVPALLAAGTIASAMVGLRLEAGAASGPAALQLDPAAAAGDGALHPARLATPVLSARRIPTVVAEPVAQRRLAAGLTYWVASSTAESCLAVATEAGQELFAHRADVPLRPASGQKLATATAALLELGSDHRYRTVVVAAEPPEGGTVAGDLYLVGGGDPLLASPDYAARFRRQPQLHTDLDELAARIAVAGVQRVTGAVVGDERRYDQVRYVPGWPDRYLAQDQIGPMSALAVNDGFAGYPPAPDAGGGLLAAPDPPANAAAVLTRLLRDRGVEVGGEGRAGSAPDGSVEIASIDSPPMAEVVAQLLRESDNDTGELVVKELGLARVGEGSTAAGIAAVEAILADGGVTTSALGVGDGSGLSLDNRMSCDLLTELLLRPGTGPILVDGLAVAGESGTLRDRFGPELSGRLRGKTGSLNTVTALAGVLDGDGGRLVFAHVANVPDGSVIGAATIGLQEGLASILLDHPQAPDLSILGPLPPEAAPTAAAAGGTSG